MATTTAPAKAGAGAGAGDDEAAGKKKRKLTPLKLVLLAVIVTLIAVGGGGYAYWSTNIKVPPPEPPPVMGDVAAFDPISINLADGHYLKLGVALQMEAVAAGGHGAKTVVPGGIALDHAIAIFSGRSIEELSDPEIRDELKEELLREAEESYHELHMNVLDVYFTEFVMQ